MGYIGNYLKKDKWWGLFILIPVILFVGYHYEQFLRETISFFPNHILSTIFCASSMIIYSLYIFKDKKIKYICLVITIIILLFMSIIAIKSGSNYYNTTILISGGETGFDFDDTYKAYLKDDKYGNLYIVYDKNIESYMINAEFKKTGNTEVILESPDGEKQIFDITIKRNSYDIKK